MNYTKFNDMDLEQYLRIIKYSFMFKKKKNIFLNKNILIFFELPSTRTKISFELASKELGCHVCIFNVNFSQLIRGENLKDTTKIMSLYSDMLIYRCFSNKKMKKISLNYKGILINALNKKEHPTQIINDIYTFYDLKGNIIKKNITWVGRNNNVFNSWYKASRIFNFNFLIYFSKKERKKYRKKFFIFKSISKACKNSDAIVTDTWNSMGKKKKKFNDLTIKKKHIFLAKKNVILLHCLPMHKNEEIKKKVLKLNNNKILEQAKNKIITCKSIIMFLFSRLCVN